MAVGPDPNRHFETDPELSGEEQRRGAGIGNPSSTRAGLPTWAIVLLVLLVLAVFLALFL